ncbi:MAG: Uma2 family endonuclease, partial [Deltaproteobacteria bacterium]|nr:Uma2 family endonuclease [Deltaproteobacteria bacterium]
PLSPRTVRDDRADKLPAYARENVRHAWLVDPAQRLLEVLRLEGGRWMVLDVFKDDARVCAEPFDAIELDLAVLWADVEPAAPPGGAARAR